MDIEEIKKYLNDNSETEEVKEFMESMKPQINRESVEAWTKEGEGRSWLDRICDIYSSKAIETAKSNAIAKFKENDMQKLIDEAVKAKSNEGKTPEQIKLEELETKLAEMEKEKTIATNKANYSKVLTEKGLPVDLLDFIYADEEEVFNGNIEKINTILQSAVTSSTNEILNKNEYIPPTSGGGVALTGVEKAFYEMNGDLAPQ
ncbi:Uncharacterised protein [Clostridium paraputrificum]|nr:Uncharacterised protein [Clostridium paraputrificum]